MTLDLNLCLGNGMYIPCLTHVKVYWNLRSFSGALRVTGAKTEPPGSDTGQSEARNAKKQKDKHPSTVADGFHISPSPKNVRRQEVRP
ncbi:hypothetical protein HanXRQr2_Chr03g0095571 [Helianthus annuus]|uniref:Uncharacterized protein n=1 Tax=Helianthus annuus TaxID=4232 RepID=A0A9K3JD17_HELAN|nr:hypothetical protein HanXRQr2_Chr03g0095571 [Helianthus annuus]KAJ0942457.1 hypothetical protein HanPSC8_Chr03g0092171 [Helianthus annuus]